MPTSAQAPQTPAPPAAQPPGVPSLPQITTPDVMAQPLEVLISQAQAIGVQLSVLRDQQRILIRALRTTDAQARATTMGQLNQVNAQIAQLTMDLSRVQSQIALRQGVTRAYPINTPPRGRPGMDPDVVAGLWFAFIFAVLMPIAIGFARRIWRGKPAEPAPRTDDSAQRLERLERAIDTIAVEIERVSESQRFMTKIMAERPATAAKVAALSASPEAPFVADPSPLRALGAGPMEPVHIPERQAVKSR